MHSAFRATLSTDTSSEAGNLLLPFLEPSSSTWGCRLGGPTLQTCMNEASKPWVRCSGQRRARLWLTLWDVVSRLPLLNTYIIERLGSSPGQLRFSVSKE